MLYITEEGKIIQSPGQSSLGKKILSDPKFGDQYYPIREYKILWPEISKFSKYQKCFLVKNLILSCVQHLYWISLNLFQTMFPIYRGHFESSSSKVSATPPSLVLSACLLKCVLSCSLWLIFIKILNSTGLRTHPSPNSSLPQWPKSTDFTVDYQILLQVSLQAKTKFLTL